MSTRSTIAVQHKDGAISAVYCHFDGYLQGVGATLLERWDSLEKAETLVALGDISTIHAKETPDRVHAYHRDRGEDLNPPRKFESVEAWKAGVHELGSNGYEYLFVDGKWSVWGRFQKWAEWPIALMSVADAIAKEEEDATKCEPR